MYTMLLSIAMVETRAFDLIQHLIVINFFILYKNNGNWYFPEYYVKLHGAKRGQTTIVE